MPASYRILVVDDNADAADTTALLLQLDGHETAVAYDATTALAEISKRSPQLVFIDLVMPNTNGLALAERLRGDPITAAIPLVALTGLGAASDRALTRAAGFVHHLLKPVAPAELARIVEQIMNPAGGRP